MSLGRTLKCRICEAPYKFYSMMVGDQSACPRCVAAAERQMREPTQDELEQQARRRSRHFGRAFMCAT